MPDIVVGPSPGWRGVGAENFGSATNADAMMLALILFIVATGAFGSQGAPDSLARQSHGRNRGSGPTVCQANRDPRQIQHLHPLRTARPAEGWPQIQVDQRCG